MSNKINASVAIQVLPNTCENKEVVRIVDKVIEYIKSKNLEMVVGPFETTIEGAVEAGAESVMSYVKINYKPRGEILTIEEKIKKYIQ